MTNTKEYFCTYCKKSSEILLIEQSESNYYHYYLETDQLEDVHGAGEVHDQKYLCVNCEKVLPRDFEFSWGSNV